MVVYKLTFINKGTRECPSHRTLDSASLSLVSLYSEFLGQAADGEPLTLDTRAADETDKKENCKFIKLSRFLCN